MDISSMLEVQMKVETDVKENVTPGIGQTSSTSVARLPISQEESNFYKHMFGNDIATVRFRRLHCTACDIHIGSAPAQASNIFEHPILHTLLCRNCYEFYGDGNFEQGDDATDMFCRWCANGGNLYCCSYCSNTFCYKCIRRNFTPIVRKKIEADEKWKCFVCNPSDLYTMRAVCWALLQHVQTVTRILKNDKKMTREEIEEKMNLDESSCCPRRSKRKRRRMESISEEEDETYSAKVNGTPITFVKPKVKKSKPYTSPISTNPNGNVKLQSYSNPIPIRPRPIALLSNQSFNQTEPPQTVIEQEERTSLSNNIVVQQHGSSNMINSNVLLSSKYDSNMLQQQTPLYRTTFMKGSNAYMQPSTAMNTAHKIIFTPQTALQSQSQSQSSSVSYQPSQSISYQQLSQVLQSSLNTMVSIPNSVGQCRSRILLPKQKESTLIPNIIELDSDSDDEPRIVEQPNVSTTNGSSNTDIVDLSSDKIVPVALAWDDDTGGEQHLRIIKATLEKNVPSLEERMRSHSRDLDKLLNNAKESVRNFLNIDDTIQDNEVAVQKKIKEYCCNMHNTVYQLLHINDRVIREYNEWTRSQKKKTDEPSSTEVNALASQDKLDISLDMTCVNDSDTESEGEIPQYQIKEPSDIIKHNIVENFLFYKKDVVHRGVGDDSVQFADKTTQVYDVLRDYEKYISHCVLTKADQHSKADDNAVEAPDKNFGKYEEQFIFYLQHVEDNGIETEDTEDTEDLNDSVEMFQEQIETNSSQSLENIASADQPTTSEQKTNLRNGINLTEDDTPINIADNDKQIVDNSDFDISIKDIYTNILNDILQETESQKVYSNTTDADEVLITLNDDGMSSSKNINDAVNIETTVLVANEEDCTIIDD